MSNYTSLLISIPDEHSPIRTISALSVHRTNPVIHPITIFSWHMHHAQYAVFSIKRGVWLLGLCIDELDKMPRTFQNQLLNFMESGRIKVDKQKKQYDFQIKGRKYLLPATRLTGYPSHYSQDSESSFYQGIRRSNSWTSEKVLRRLSSRLAKYIGATVWKNGGDIRDVISIGKLVRKSDGSQEIELIMETMMKYGMDGKEKGVMNEDERKISRSSFNVN